MRREFRILATGLLGGVVLHVAGVLAFPGFAGRDLWESAASYGPEGAFALVPQPAPGAETFDFLDPNMVHAICRVDLSAGGRRITADLDVDFWSMGVLDRRGRNRYSLTNEVAGAGALDALIIRSDDLTPLRRNPPAILEEAVVVDLAIDHAIVVLRAFVAEPTLRPFVAAELAAANCDAPFDLGPPPLLE